MYYKKSLMRTLDSKQPIIPSHITPHLMEYVEVYNNNKTLPNTPQDTNKISSSNYTLVQWF